MGCKQAEFAKELWCKSMEKGGCEKVIKRNLSVKALTGAPGAVFGVTYIK